MVTTTLKLGISILNGGNSEVQRVCVLKIKQKKVTHGFFMDYSLSFLSENAGIPEG